MQKPEFKNLHELDALGKKVLLRVDVNVPIKDGVITDETRIREVLPTIRYLANQGAKVILLAHFGRPKGKFLPEMSLQQIVSKLAELLNPIKISFVKNCIGEEVKDAVSKMNFGEILLLENLRFYSQEIDGDPDFSKQLAELGDIYVNDAFSCSHRAHSSITGIPQFLPAFAGFLMEKELRNLENLLLKTDGDILAVVGGAKISTKIDLLRHLSTKVKSIFIAGGMANSFFYAQNYSVGKSLCEPDLAQTALEIIDFAAKNKCEIILPVDVTAAKEFRENAENRNITPRQVEQEVTPDELILDIGIESSRQLQKLLNSHQILVWNGPLGAFEIPPFNRGTFDFARIVAEQTRSQKLLSIAGGGDVVAAINSCNLAEDFSYISTAGGAFLEWLEGKLLPGIAALAQK